MSEHKVRCDICKEDFRATTSHINLICKECQNKEKQELIEEFLKDWRWGRVYGIHFSWLNFYNHCRCKPTIIQYWKWFEEKWEKRLIY